MDEDIILEDTVGAQQKRAVVMIGRMNPPTLGHYTVIDRMKAFQRSNRDVTPIVVVIAGKETSKDLAKNPLSADDRVKFMTASGRANGIKFLTATSAMEGFEAVRKAGYEPYAIAAGSDRAAKYIELLDKYFTDANGGKLEHVVMPGLKEREDPDDDGVPSEEVLALAENGEDIPVHLISGSMARLAVKLGYKSAFAKILGVNRQLGDIIFRKVARSLQQAAADERAAAEKKEAEAAAKRAAAEARASEKAAARAAKKVK